MANEIKFTFKGMASGQGYMINTEVADNDYPVMGSGIKAAIEGSFSEHAAENIPSLTAAPTKEDINAILDALKAAGLMEPDPEPEE